MTEAVAETHLRAFLTRLRYAIRTTKTFGTPGAAMTRVEAPDDLMTAADAARLLSLSVDMVRLLARNGKLACTTTVGGMRLFRRADVERLVTERSSRRGLRP